MSWVEKLFDSGLYEHEYAGLNENAELAERQAAFIADVLELAPQDEVLDLACGGGRHAVALADRVGRVTGFDRTGLMLDRARELIGASGASNVALVEGDMRELDYAAVFDAAYNYYTSWGYYSREENQDVLVRVHRSLKPGGRFLLETLNRVPVLSRFQPTMWHRTPDGTRVLTDHEFDFAEGRITSRRTYLTDGGEETVEIDHELPAPDDMVRRFRAAGFRDVRLLSAPDGGELTADSLRMAVTGRA